MKKLKFPKITEKTFKNPVNLAIIAGIGLGGFVIYHYYGTGILKKLHMGMGKNAAPQQGDIVTSSNSDLGVFFNVSPINATTNDMVLIGYFYQKSTNQHVTVPQGYYYITQDANNTQVIRLQGSLGSNVSDFQIPLNLNGMGGGGYTAIVTDTPLPPNMLTTAQPPTPQAGTGIPMGQQRNPTMPLNSAPQTGDSLQGPGGANFFL